MKRWTVVMELSCGHWAVPSMEKGDVIFFIYRERPEVLTNVLTWDTEQKVSEFVQALKNTKEEWIESCRRYWIVPGQQETVH